MPNYCCCCWVQLFVNKIWPCLWHESKPLLNRCPPRWGSGLFSERLVKKGLRLEHKALEFSQKAEERELEGRREWIGLIAELEGVLARQVEKWKKHRCHSAEHLLVLLLLKRREHNTTRRTMSRLLTSVFIHVSVSADGLHSVIEHVFSPTGTALWCKLISPYLKYICAALNQTGPCQCFCIF